MQPRNQKTRKLGLTIIEVTVAIFLLAVGAIGVFVLVNRALGQASVLESRLVAAYLAQEGIEIVRNIRDTNWIAGANWNDNLPPAGPQSGRVLDYQTQGPPYAFFNINQPLNIEDGSGGGREGFYGYKSGTPTKFSRQIQVRYFDADGDGNDDTAEITITVYWQERAQTYEFKAKEAIYNWRQ